MARWKEKIKINITQAQELFVKAKNEYDKYKTTEYKIKVVYLEFLISLYKADRDIPQEEAEDSLGGYFTGIHDGYDMAISTLEIFMDLETQYEMEEYKGERK